MILGWSNKRVGEGIHTREMKARELFQREEKRKDRGMTIALTNTRDGKVDNRRQERTAIVAFTKGGIGSEFMKSLCRCKVT
jgi:hypothetical protein